MRKPAKIFSTFASAAVLFGSLAMGSAATAAEEEATKTPAQQGKEIAFDRRKGNCLACHAMDDGVSPGNIGPPLIAMKARFPDRKRLEAQIEDATQFNANSPMPPFGRHKILSGDDISNIVDYLYTL